jgi:hypothetical protein
MVVQGGYFPQHLSSVEFEGTETCIGKPFQDRWRNVCIDQSIDIHRLPPLTHIHNSFHKVSQAASNVGWRTNPPTHTKDYGIKSLALFIPFPFALIESLWLLLIGKNVV